MKNWLFRSFVLILLLPFIQALAHTNSRYHAHKSCHQDEWDYIIVGDGTAGAVLARKLSDNFKNKVLVLEWGENHTNDPVVLTPSSSTFRDLLVYDSKYAVNTIIPIDFDSQLEKQFFIYSDGRMWGGSSAHNGLFAVRGTPNVYNLWALFTGNPRWFYNNLLPYMLALESYYPDGTIPNARQRGFFGPLSITQSPPLNQSNPFDSALAAGTFAPFISDYNDPSLGNIGFSAHQQYITPLPNSHRTFSAGAFHPVGIIVDEEGKGLEGRQLLIQSNALVNRVLFDGHQKAIGVEYLFQNSAADVRQVYAKKKIILCGGSIWTPTILERSGIGNGELLRALDIDVIVDNPHVGEHLINHYGPIALVAGFTSGIPILNGYINAAPFMNNDDVRRLQILGSNVPPGNLNLVSLRGLLLQPQSRGSVHIVNNNPTIYPRVNLNMFSDGSVFMPGTDAYLVVSFYKILQQIALTNPGFGPIISPASTVYAGGDIALLEFAQNLDNLSVTFHIAGTARMGTSINDGVVDGNLHVFGVKNLMIADVSVEPVIEDGNTAYAAYILGLVAADIITAEKSKNKK